MFTGKTIFFGALDWGLGHATRSVPIIKELLKNNIVILGITPLTKIIFDEEFPELKKIELPSYNITYSKILPLWMKLGSDFPRITRIIAKENETVQKIIEENKIDILISDNRFGLYSEKIHSVFITHQLFLKAPVFRGLADQLNHKYISKFNEVWVPDYENAMESLSGELSHGKYPANDRYKNVRYIGPQSRLKNIEVDFEKDKYDLLILLSGPEPSRNILEESLLKILGSTGKKIAFVRGKAQEEKNKTRKAKAGERIEIYDLPAKKEIKQLILSSKKIICRSGYSTLMDMHLLGKKELILIPTPGQSEQEYLAGYWKHKFGAEIATQNELDKLINFAL